MTSRNWRKYEIISLLMDRYKNFNIEIYYLLKWISNETQMIDNLEFTNDSNFTPRGLRLEFNSDIDNPYIYFKNKLVYFNYDQIIHDLRMNQQDILYLEVVFDDHKIKKLLDEVQIDNPYAPGYQTFEEKIDTYLEHLSTNSYIKYLEDRIDEAIENKDYHQLELLVDCLEKQKKESKHD